MNCLKGVLAAEAAYSQNVFSLRKLINAVIIFTSDNVLIGSEGMYFYKDLFASLCFIFFGAALPFKHPYLYFGAMMCGCFSITAKKKQWSDPIWARLYMEKINEWMDRMEPKKEFSEDEEIRPLPPLDDRK